MSAALRRARNAGLPAAARLTRRPESGDPGRVLILQPDHIGDIILSEPAIRLLRKMLPNRELIAVVGPWSEEITRMAWPVDRIITLEYPGFTRSSAGRPWDPYGQLIHEATRLRELQAGTALVLRPDAWWAAWLARSSVPGAVYGIGHPQARPFLTRAATAPAPHRTISALTVARLALGSENEEVPFWDMSPSLSLPRPAVEKARQLRDRLGMRSPYIVLHPGAGARVKLWPASRWVALAAAIGDVQIVLTGSPDERDLCSTVARSIENTVNAAGQSDLGTLAEVMRGAEAAVGTDNGAMHIAGAVGTPTVRLFGPSDPDIYGPKPASPRHRVVSAGWHCPRCGDLGPDRRNGCGCMLAISVEMVLAAIDEVLAVGHAT